jgi:hypothetical protein
MYTPVAESGAAIEQRVEKLDRHRDATVFSGLLSTLPGASPIF